MRSFYHPELLGTANPAEDHEIANTALVGTPSIRVLDICEPHDLRRDISQGLKLLRRQSPG